MADLIESILLHALETHASDLFLTADKVPSYRICGNIVFPPDGVPVPGAEIDRFRCRVLSPEAETAYLHDGTADASWSFPSGERFRLNFFTSAGGPAMAIRPILSGNQLNITELNLPPVLETLCKEQRGLILITGSTGSGKSTTLGAIINQINQTQGKHILTIEDPIEFLHPNAKSLVSQREVSSHSGGFGAAMRSAMRENPDVIVIGEIRDLDTMQAALNASLTGHLVISTLHTSDTIQSIERLINMYPVHLQEQAAIDLGMALLAVLSQRLIPRKNSDRMIPAVEILLGTPMVRKSIADRNYNFLDDSLRRGTALGMVTFAHAIFQCYRNDLITLENARRAVTNTDEFDLLLKGMESGTDSFRNYYGESFDSEDNSLVNMRFLLRMALDNHASDLHLTVNTPPMLRINGILRPIDLPPLSGVDIQRLLYSVISPRQRVELEEKRELDFALSVQLTSDEQDKVRFRINAFFQRGSLGTVARVVNSVIPSPQSLSLPPPVLGLIEKHQGLIMVTGPTGSGKSTTLASLIDQINSRRNAKIITIEDPIEYVHRNKCSVVEQRELHSDTLSFASALKFALRQDPDVIMVGEMRDVETIAAVLTAAETGHLVFATIHTNSAPQTVDRIVDSFPSHQQNQIRQQLASVILGVISQRLLPRADGAGRAAAFEVLIGTPPVQSLIREGKTHQLQSVLETSGKDGMITLDKSMENLYNAGIVTLEATKGYHADYKQTQEF
ncbi:MAG: PilT/PilU family type 4a pilus ATPase [Lentisphaerae bacterium]|nr:PilT/PilU family type 4a pilus ATPase [Lentisphaerota bacterium]